MRDPSADSMIPKPFRIQRTRNETHDTFTMELVPKSGNGGFNFSPGQFNMLYVFGVGEVPISISGDAGDTELLVHTIRAVGTVTKAMRKLKRGDPIGVRGPFGRSWPVSEAEGNDVVIVAGGIGLAPLRPTIYHLLSKREKYGKVMLLYGTRTPSDILFRKELEQWRGRFDFEVELTVDRAMGDWRGNVFRSSEHDRDGVRTRSHDAIHRRRVAQAGRSAQRHPYLDGAEHEVRHWPLRTLPVRSDVHLQRWTRVPVRSRAAPFPETGNLT